MECRERCNCFCELLNSAMNWLPDREPTSEPLVRIHQSSQLLFPFPEAHDRTDDRILAMLSGPPIQFLTPQSPLIDSQHHPSLSLNNLLWSQVLGQSRSISLCPLPSSRFQHTSLGTGESSPLLPLTLSSLTSLSLLSSLLGPPAQPEPPCLNAPHRNLLSLVCCCCRCPARDSDRLLCVTCQRCVAWRTEVPCFALCFESIRLLFLSQSLSSLRRTADRRSLLSLWAGSCVHPRKGGVRRLTFPLSLLSSWLATLHWNHGPLSLLPLLLLSLPNSPNFNSSSSLLSLSPPL
jgi:hypothetical protein